MWVYLGQVALGVALLVAGGEALVRGASAGALRLGASTLFVGLVVLGFGTSLPELVVSLHAALAGRPGIAVGNVVGSNLSNTLLVVGMVAVLQPMRVPWPEVQRDGLAMLLASLLAVLAMLNGWIGRLESVLLFLGLCVYLVTAWRSDRSREGAGQDAVPVEGVAGWKGIALLVPVGLGVLILGAKLLVDGATGLATAAGLSEALIGLTVVAVGTSLPELTVSVLAALKGSSEMSVGNILGSNIFNLMGILGVAGVVSPLPVDPRILVYDQWVMLGAALALVLLIRLMGGVGRVAGVGLLLGYAGWVALGV